MCKSSFLLKIDNIIIDSPYGFQRVSDEIEYCTSYDHLQVAMCLTYILIASGMSMIVHLLTLTMWSPFGIALSFFFLTIICLHQVFTKLEVKDIQTQQEYGRPNPYRQRMDYVVLRVFCMGTGLLMVGYSLVYVSLGGGNALYGLVTSFVVYMIAYLCLMYFLACEKAPPKMVTRPESL